MKTFTEWLKLREGMTDTSDIAAVKKPIGDSKKKGDKTSPDVLDDGKKKDFPGFKKVDKSDKTDKKCNKMCNKM